MADQAALQRKRSPAPHCILADADERSGFRLPGWTAMSAAAAGAQEPAAHQQPCRSGNKAGSGGSGRIR
eukprot:581720-Heterocapsa_arctica.AAC.1